MNDMGHESKNKLLKLVMSESKPSKMPTPFQKSVVTMESVTDKVKELLAPDKKKKLNQNYHQTKENK